MAQRNSTAGGFPWLGWIALGAASFLLGTVLVTPGLRAGLLNTWYLTRAAGLVAYALLWLSVVIGLLQSTGFLKGASSPIANIDIHTYVSVGALYATTFHMVILLFDRYVPFTLSGLLIPFASPYKPLLVGLGGLALYISLGVTVTSYLRGKLNPKTWRTIHLTSLAAFVMALAHGLFMGTDSGSPYVGYLYRFSFLSVLLLVGYRIYLGVNNHADSVGRR